MTPQLLIAGHIVKDRTAAGWEAGGGALFAAAQADRLGVDVAVVTACESDVQPSALVQGVEWRVKRIEQSIRFENIYEGGRRRQRVLSTSETIGLDDIPIEWRGAPLILLTPVFHDVDPGLPGELVNAGTIVGLGAQGWLRRLDGERVLPGEVEPAPEWLQGDVVFLSEEDVRDPEAAERWRAQVSTVVLTRGRAGFTVWDAAARHDIPPVRGCEKDPTGAGDVFATAYLVRFGETRDVLESARFAAAAAALSIEGHGIEAVATRPQIESRLSAGVNRSW
jgi:hypothetical protein